jgi:hypothetical protein
MFIVMRTHTQAHYAKKVMWQVVSRPFERKQDADFYKDFCQKEYNEETPKGTQKFFVIETDFTGTLGN